MANSATLVVSVVNLTLSASYGALFLLSLAGQRLAIYPRSLTLRIILSKRSILLKQYSNRSLTARVSLLPHHPSVDHPAISVCPSTTRCFVLDHVPTVTCYCSGHLPLQQ
jgi:hypothetical protein